MSTQQPPFPDPQGGPQPTGSASFFDSMRRLNLPRADDRWFGGVASGIAHRLGIDPLLVRGLFVIATIFSGLGCLVYGVAWLLLPEARDGRIHVESVSRGQVDAGFVGGVVMTLIGLGGVPFGLAVTGGWAMIPLAVVALLIVLLLSKTSQKPLPAYAQPTGYYQPPMPGGPVPGSSAPAAGPGASYPGASYPGAAQPGATQPGLPNPGATHPGATYPASGAGAGTVLAAAVPPGQVPTSGTMAGPTGPVPVSGTTVGPSGQVPTSGTTVGPTGPVPTGAATGGTAPMTTPIAGSATPIAGPTGPINPGQVPGAGIPPAQFGPTPTGGPAPYRPVGPGTYGPGGPAGPTPPPGGPPRYYAAPMPPPMPPVKPPAPLAPRRKPAGPVIVSLAAAFALLASAFAIFFSRATQWEFSNARLVVLTVGIIVAVIGFVILLVGTAGRKSGGLTPLAIVALIVACPVMVLSLGQSNYYEAVGSHFWFPSSDYDDDPPSYDVGIGFGHLDLTNIDVSSGPVHKSLNYGVGGAHMILPSGIPTTIECHVGVGSVEFNDLTQAGWEVTESTGVGPGQSNGRGGWHWTWDSSDIAAEGIDRLVTATSPEVLAGAEPLLTVTAQGGVGDLRISLTPEIVVEWDYDLDRPVDQSDVAPAPVPPSTSPAAPTPPSSPTDPTPPPSPTEPTPPSSPAQDAPSSSPDQPALSSSAAG